MTLSDDFVLVFNPFDSSRVQDKYREVFEENLKEEGLVLTKNEDSKNCFVRVHATHEVLCRYAEIMKIRLPMRNIPGQEEILENHYFLDTVRNNIYSILRFVNIDPEYFTENKYQLTAEFDRSKLYLFDVDDAAFFPEAVKISVVAFILERISYSMDPGAAFDFGIERLLENGTYKAAFPLHDGCYSDPETKRSLLISTWATMKNWLHFQPIDIVKDYFGIKFALYFAWFGFYTHMLIPASIFGIICFVFGATSLNKNSYSNDICDTNLNITMCPQCNVLCDYWNLHDSCIQAKLTYMFDNSYTVTFAVFMSLWGSLYLEMWKRYSAEIAHKWGLTGFDLEAEHPRPKYLAKLKDSKKKRLNVVTQRLEPDVSFWRVRVPFMLLSYTVVLFLVALTFAAVFGIILYRMSLAKSQIIFGSKENIVYKDVIIPASAAVLNLVIITILNFVYGKVAWYLTELELLRTQTEVDDSLTLKIFLFQFVNNFSSIFYIAFFKGKFVGHPSNYNKIFGIRQEECSPGGCFHEIFIQLVITMVGRKILSYLLHFIKNLLMTLFKVLKSFQSVKNLSFEKKYQWTEDYRLQEWPERGLFDEYLEIVLQYGFVTIFVAAFPLAPIFALLVNILELRRDAKKFLKNHRRPIPQRAKDIGVWYYIMDVLGRLAVIVNAFIIAFTSNFIPRLVYIMVVNKNHTDEGFLNHSLAFFDTNNFENGPPSNSSYGDIAMCRYRDYRNPPWESDGKKYQHSHIYWHVLVARLAFVVVFQNVVSVVRIIVRWAIPDMSRKLKDQIKREAYLTTEIIMKYEATLSKNRR